MLDSNTSTGAVASSPEGARIETPRAEGAGGVAGSRPHPRARGLKQCWHASRRCGPESRPHPRARGLKLSKVHEYVSARLVASSPEGARIETCSPSRSLRDRTSRPHPRARGLKHLLCCCSVCSLRSRPHPRARGLKLDGDGHCGARRVASSPEGARIETLRPQYSVVLLRRVLTRGRAD